LILIFVVTWILSAISSRFKKDEDEVEEEGRESFGGSVFEVFRKAASQSEEDGVDREGWPEEQVDQRSWAHDQGQARDYEHTYYMEDEYDMYGGVPEPGESDTAYYGYDQAVTPDPINPKWWGA
jgi:hypothetical protein